MLTNSPFRTTLEVVLEYSSCNASLRDEFLYSEIVENPVESVTVQDISIIEGTSLETREDWETTLSAIFDRMYAKSVELGGLVSGEHGIGYAKKEFLKRQYGETPIALMQGIKQVFDPKNILNPGKVCF